MATLQSPVPNSVATYPILIYPNKNSYVGRNIWMWGHSMHNNATCPDVPNGWTYNQGADFSMKVGRNRISGYDSIHGQKLLANYDTDRAGDIGKAEAAYRHGSSGAPVFSMYGAKPCLIGCAAGVTGGVCTPQVKENNVVVDGRATVHGSTNKISTLDKAELDSFVSSKQSGVPLHERIKVVYRTTTFCDFDGDYARDADDLDIVVREIRQWGLGADRGYNWYLDRNGDGTMTNADLQSVLNTFNKLEGDANLDGQVNHDDFVIMIGNVSKMEQGWADGDFTGDGVVDNSDFTLWENNN